MDASVVICTHDRTDLLPRALASVAVQTLDPARWELVLVDSASTEPARPFLDTLLAEHPQLRGLLVELSVPGLGGARNAGVAAASGAVVGFLDDDAVAEPNWLERAVQLFESADPELDGLGGPIEPLYAQPRPPWLSPDIERRSWGNESRFLARGESFSGSNMFVRRALVDEFGGFDVELGVVGKTLSLGEEDAFFQTVWSAYDGARFLYSPDLVVHHEVPAHKLRPTYHLRRAYAYGQTVAIREQRSGRSSGRILAGAGVAAVRHAGSALVHPRRDVRAWLVDEWRDVVADAGRAAQAIGLERRPARE